MDSSKPRSWISQKFSNLQAEVHRHAKTILKSGLGYGFGLTLGGVISKFFFNNVHPSMFTGGNDAQQLVAGLILAFVIMAIGGSIAGLIGGSTLPRLNSRRRRTIVIMSSLSMGILFSLLIFPLILVIGLLSFYDVAELRPRLFGIVIGLVGLLFGVLMGLWMGAVALGSSRAGRVARPTSIGFGLGGFLFGICLWVYLSTYSSPDIARGGWIWLLLGLFVFASLGGGALGLAFGRIRDGSENEVLLTTFKQAMRRYWIITVILIFAVFYLRPVISAIADMLTPYSAGLASVLSSQTLGTHWKDPIFLTAKEDSIIRSQPALYVTPALVGLAWTQSNGATTDVYYTIADQQPDGSLASWQSAVNVSASARQDSSSPQEIIDDSGMIHIAWVEALGTNESDIHVILCRNGNCDSPVILSAEQQDLECSWTNPDDRKKNDAPHLAINGEQIMLTWQSAGQVLYSTWSAQEPIPQLEADCLTSIASGTEFSDLVAGPENGFSLVFSSSDTNRTIYETVFDGQTWGEKQALEQEGNPTIHVDSNGETHLAWCGLDQSIYYQSPQGEAQHVSRMTCIGKPALLMDSQNNLHSLWVSESVENKASPSQAVLYESKLVDGIWQPAALVYAGTGNPDELIQFSSASDPTGTLHLSWPSSNLEPGSIGYATQVQYSCPSLPENRLSQVVYEAAAPYRSAGEPPPYCGNQYERLLFAPNPRSAFSDETPSANGVFDKLGESIRDARYEVLVSTMWYESDLNLDSPGAVVASAVADLYRQVKENPDRYPRGMTVRILLGNPPEVVMDETSDQLWSVLNDLRNAAVEEMSNPDIGWQVETANFEGSMPHSHSKMLIVDGKRVVAAGFNFEYYHFPINHPSGLGEDRWDMAMQVSGPVAQDAMQAFDDLWQGSNGRTCNFHPSFEIGWETTCRNYPVTAVHTPEVLKYYLPGGTSDTFSMYRTEAHAESDAEIVALVSAAQNSVDLTHVNFTLELVCDLNILYDICNIRQAMPYYGALLKAAENGAHLRILVEQGSIEGVETMVGLKIFLDEAAKRGVSDQIEVRFFNGWMHFKTSLVDDQFLVVGSQNYHYSAFGDQTGLAEYSLGTDDPQAIEDYKRFFEYQWEQAIPLSE
jgi:phosphatidylserine/phosphatidylglycerophosphate/cardiolipin synthase-like enzyme/MFS family permease